MADGVYNRGKYLIASGGLDWTTNTFKVLLVDSSYTFDADQNFVSDLVASELSATGYSGGFSGTSRLTVASKTVTENDTANTAEIDCGDFSFGTISTGDTIGGLVLYKNGTSDADSELISFCDLTDTPTNGSPVSVTVNSAGIINLV